MLNIYRVISLSLVISLFFAAPLLCVQPASFRLKREQSLAAKLRQPRKITVNWHQDSERLYPRGSDALAQSLLQAKKVKDDATVSSLFVEGQEEYGNHHEEDRIDPDDTDDFGGATTVSNTSL